MKITLSLTEAQEAALTRSNASANPDEATRPTLEDFAAETASSKFDEHVAAWRGRDISGARSAIERHADKLTDADLAEIAAVAAKYDTL